MQKRAEGSYRLFSIRAVDSLVLDQDWSLEIIQHCLDSFALWLPNFSYNMSRVGTAASKQSFVRKMGHSPDYSESSCFANEPGDCVTDFVFSSPHVRVQ